jgi:hypothetical protein
MTNPTEIGGNAHGGLSSGAASPAIAFGCQSQRLEHVISVDLRVTDNVAHC